MSLARNLFIVVYLAVQVVLPLRALVLERHDTRGHFSWNMYSQNYDCTSIYLLTDPSGETKKVKLSNHFKRGRRTNMIYYRDILPDFNRYLCDYYGRRGRLQTLRADVRCSWNGAAPVPLTDPAVDVCRAPNYGVP
jgi:hypothetical protein